MNPKDLPRSLADAFAPAEARYKAEVMAATWGHLAPEPNRKYPGTILFCHGEYGDITVIRSDFPDLPGSPWFAGDETDFLGNQVVQRGEVIKPAGTIWRWSGYYIKFKTGNYRFTGKVCKVVIDG